jgi:hypothetical protein
MISTVTLTLDLTTKKGRVTDTTNYTSLDISVATYEAKGLGTIYFQGQQIEQRLTVGTPLIDLQAGDTYFEFDLELDVNGEVANGVYTVDYLLRLNTYPVSTNSLGVITAPSTITFSATNFEWLPDFLVQGNTMNIFGPGTVLGQQSLTIDTCELIETDIQIVFNEVINDAYSFWRFNVTNQQSEQSFTYSGCTRATAAITFTYDCDYAPNGTFSVASATRLVDQTVSSTNALINFPSWTSANPNFNPRIVTSTLPYTQNTLATGTFSVSLTQVIQQLQDDGLIMQYTTSTTEEFLVSCTGSLCGLNTCIENLRRAHVAELRSNRISKYQQYVDSILMYYIEAQTYRICGEFDKYKEALNNIQAQLDSSGCDCSCCDDEVFEWIQVNTNATIESLINEIQYRLKNGIPDDTDDSAAGVQIGAIWQDTNTGILYRCSVNTPGNAVWNVYYDPGSIIVTASGVISNAQAGGIVLGTNVQANIDSINVALINNDASITGLVNDVNDLNIEIGGLVEGVTGDFVDNTDPQNPIINNPSASQVSYSATIDGSTITTAFGALEKLRVSESDYSNSLIYYPAQESVKTTLNLALTAKVALSISDTAVVQVIGNSAYDSTASTPTFIAQPDNTFNLAFPVQFVTSFSTIHVTPQIKGDTLTQVKVSRISNNTVKIAFYYGGSTTPTATASPIFVTIEVYR